MKIRVYARTETAKSIRDMKTADIAIIAGCCEGGSTKFVSKPGGGGIAGCWSSGSSILPKIQVTVQTVDC